MEKELVTKTLKGDNNSFEVLVEKHNRGVFSLCYRVFQDKNLAEDMTQEAFVRAYTRLHTYNPDYKFSNWLLKIATNLCNDYFRKNKNRSKREISLDKMAEEGKIEGLIARYYSSKSAEEQALIQLDQEKISQDLKKAVNNLHPKARLLLNLRYEKSLSHKELAEYFDVNSNNIKIMLHRARSRLRVELEKII
ncbi:sigma-70 family RNA polymerase sigma factor [Candidatus Riflebacteria bacterium]